MKRLLFSILLLPVMANAQGNKEIFGRFSTPATGGHWLKGTTSKHEDFRDYFIVTDLVASSSNNNTSVQFTVPVSPGANAFHFGATLLAGEIVVTTRGPGRPVINYKITMQLMSVVESTTVNDMLKLKLDATRIGFTYYEVDNKGVYKTTSKNGWDKGKGAAWTDF